jgi:hypothetical protein
MTQQTDGKDQAFPRPASHSPEFGPVHPKLGLTKREYFAAMAMQGVASDRPFSEFEFSKLAEWSVKQADALIEALNKEK